MPVASVRCQHTSLSNLGNLSPIRRRKDLDCCATRPFSKDYDTKLSASASQPFNCRLLRLFGRGINGSSKPLVHHSEAYPKIKHGNVATSSATTLGQMWPDWTIDGRLDRCLCPMRTSRTRGRAF